MKNIHRLRYGYAWFAIPALAIVFFVISPLITHDRGDFTEYLQNHPYYPDNSRHLDLDKIPKQDRPDLAWQQDFLRTMDPQLGRPATERLASARVQVKAYFENKAKSRTGTEDFPWVERGPTNVGGRTRGLMWDPNDENGKKVWAGGTYGGLWYTTDIYTNTTQWTKVDDFWDNIAVSAITHDPNNTNIFYVGTGEGWGVGASRGGGIWKTTDSGQNWALLSASSEFYYVNDLAVRNENGTSVLYAAVRANFYEGEWHGLGAQGLQRSTDGGSTFTQSMKIIPNESIPYAIADIEIAADNKLWVAATTNAFNADDRGGGSILHSENGTSWTLSTQRTDGNRVEIACAPSNESIVYALVENDGTIGEVIKTTDGGATWTSLSEPNDADTGIPASDFSRGQAWYDLILAVDPNDENVVLAGAIDLFRSEDGGGSWGQISHWYGGFDFPYVHADQHAIAYKPGSSTDVIFGHDGGIDLSITMDQSEPSFINRNNNYNVTQFYAAAIHPEAGTDYFLAGSQDNGTQRFTSAGLGSTTEASGGDGAFCFIDQDNPNVQISSYVYNNYWVSTNGGASFPNNFTISDDNTGQFINPADYDDTQNILYTATDESSIGRFSNIGNGTPSRADLSVSLGGIASHLRVSPYNTASTTLFVGTISGKLFKITNASATSSSAEITGANFPSGNISCVEIGASENELLVTFSNYGVNSVWYSGDGGTSWSSKEGNMPDIPVRWALFNPNNRSEVIIATDLGVWRTEAISESSPTWVPSNIGLANVRVDMLQIRESDHEVIAATYGRGLYSSSGFAEGSGNTIDADFSASVSTIAPGESVSFTDESTGSPTSWQWTFEGGTPGTSTAQNPTVTYSSTGSYDVTLQVTDAQGNTDTKTGNNFILVTSGDILPNLTAFQSEGWAGDISASTIENDFENLSNISTEDDIYLSYGMKNDGNLAIDQTFNVSVTVDDAEVLSKQWVFSQEDPFPIGLFNTDTNIGIGALGEGEHTVKVILDVNEAIDESDESDNTFEYGFYVQESCIGEQLYTDMEGSITDGSGPSAYLNDRDCYWVIEPENAVSITLTFSEFDLEDDFDYLHIYAGSDEETPVASLTGSGDQQITIDEGKVILHFESDNSVSQGGWSLSYTSEVIYSDLEMLSLEAVYLGDELEVSLDISNSGAADMTEIAEVNLYFSEDNEWSEDDMMIGTLETSLLASGDSETIVESVSLPGINPGEYFAIAIADEGELIQEELEDNNSLSVSFDVLVLGLGTPQALEVFPNPVTDQLTVRLAQGGTFTLTNISGQVLSKGLLKAENAIDLAGFQKGIYLLTVRQGDKQTSVRIKKN